MGASTLSGFTGATHERVDAVEAANRYDIDAFVLAIHKALAMDEKAPRRNRGDNVHSWAEELI
jgi:hypothetical protein